MEGSLLVVQGVVNKMIKPISELLEVQKETVDQMNTEPEEKPEVQIVEDYSAQSVIELLKQSLNIHWQQTTVLSAQAVHLERWGYKKLAEVIKADAQEEHKHAMINLARLEFFDIDYQPLVVSPPVWVRHDMMAMLKYNLASVREAAAAERATITAARAVGDELTANVMIPLLQGSEDAIVLYEGYLKLIEQMGLDNFLSIQV
jgi:bacterioferritin (cytochrome b1)